MSVLLVISTGRTDVQLVDAGERVELAGRNCGELHLELAERETDWSISCALLRKSNRRTVDSLPPGPFEICTPKLEAVIVWAQNQNIQITHAVVLATDRIDDRDPRQAGPILKRRLESAGIQVQLLTYLEGNEALEDRTVPRDAIIRHEVVERIDEGLQAALQAVNPDMVILAATGGIPEVKLLTEDMVRLYAGADTRVELLDIPDASQDTGGIELATTRSSAPRPHDSFVARRNALELVHGGNLIGAWGAVRHLHSDPMEHQWTRVIEWLQLWTSSLPLPSACNIPLLVRTDRAPRAACWVEFALKAGDIPRAVHGTVAFLEAGLWDHLRTWLVEHPQSPRNFRPPVWPIPPDLIALDRPSPHTPERPFQPTISARDGRNWYRVCDDREGIRTLAGKYLSKPKLEALSLAVNNDIWDLRHDVAHNVPTPQRMAEAKSRMRDAGLWSAHDSFLAQPLVRETLCELQVQNPESLCVDLVAEIERRLLTP